MIFIAKPHADEDSSANSAPGLEEVIVSASYRDQDIQDVVGGIQVFGGESLDRSGVQGMEDYLRDVPSVSLQKSGVGKSNISIRGISNLNTLDIGYADGSPTVGVYFNDVAIQGSGVFPDLNIFDLNRIEVLKGPQGTLYGEGSMGGAIKMIMNAPNLQEWRFKFSGSVSELSIEDTDLNWDYRAAVNVPLIQDKLATRIVGSKTSNAGFVSYTSQGIDDGGQEDKESLRLQALWVAAEWLEVEYFGMYDFADRKQLPVVNAGSEEKLENNNREDQFAETKFITHSITGRVDLGFANLTSVTSVFETIRDTQTRVPILQTILNTALNDPNSPNIFHTAYTHSKTDLDSFSQELRLVSMGDERFDWIVGYFYRDRNQKFKQEKFEEFDPDAFSELPPLFSEIAFGGVSGKQEDGFGEEPFKQTAIYGEVNYEIIQNRLDLTAGIRWFKDTVGFFQDTEFFRAEAAIFATDPDNVDEDGRVTVFFGDELTTEDVLSKLSLAWYVSDNVMLFGTASKGFRSGTPNLFAALDSGPPIVRPDFVLNKELGAKTAWFDGRLIVNLGIYEIDWDDFQGLVIGTATLGNVGPIPFAHLANAGDSRIQGAELSMVWQATERLGLAFNAGYNTGEVVKPDPDNNVLPDSEIPNKPRFTWSTNLSYNRQVWGDILGSITLTYTHVDEQTTVFQTPEVPDGLPIESYSLTSAIVGLEGSNWRAQLFSDNLMDDRVVTAISLPGPLYAVNRPRTLGLRFSYDY